MHLLQLPSHALGLGQALGGELPLARQPLPHVGFLRCGDLGVHLAQLLGAA